MHWEARWGTIDNEGFYRAPSFPCEETVSVRGRYLQDSIQFEVKKRPLVGPQDVSPQDSLFRLIDLPKVVAERRVEFRFFFQGGDFMVTCNGVVVFQGTGRQKNSFRLTLPLKEGVNWIALLAEGRELFSQVVVCDTCAPEVRISRAKEVPEGILLEGWVEDWGNTYLSSPGMEREKFSFLVPWQKEVTKEWKDLAGNLTREVFSIARDFQCVIEAPSLVKRGQIVRLGVFCRYRDVPVEGVTVTYGYSGEKTRFETGEGFLEHVFWEEGETILPFMVAGMTFEIPFLVQSPVVGKLTVSAPFEVVAGETFSIHGTVISLEGEGCGREEGVLEVLNGGGEKLREFLFLTDEAGLFHVPLSLSVPGQYRLILRSGEQSFEQELQVLSSVPSGLKIVSPSSNSIFVAGSEVTFEVQVLSPSGQGLGGVRIGWQWEKEEGGEVDALELWAFERSDVNGLAVAKFKLPTRVGTYFLNPLPLFWDISSPSFRIQIDPANLGQLVDYTSLPSRIGVNEEVLFTLEALDIYGNSVGNQAIQVYVGKDEEPLTKETTVVTSPDGKANFILSFPGSGTWKVKASTLFLAISWEIRVEDE